MRKRLILKGLSGTRTRRATLKSTSFDGRDRIVPTNEIENSDHFQKLSTLVKLYDFQINLTAIGDKCRMIVKDENSYIVSMLFKFEHIDAIFMRTNEKLCSYIYEKYERNLATKNEKHQVIKI